MHASNLKNKEQIQIKKKKRRINLSVVYMCVFLPSLKFITKRKNFSILK